MSEDKKNYAPYGAIISKNQKLSYMSLTAQIANAYNWQQAS
jgi:hypothetical protein